MIFPRSGNHVDSQFGLINLWNQGDLITKGVALLLLIMSLASWTVIIVKVIDLRKFSVQARMTESFWRAPDFADGLARLGTDPTNPFRSLALEGREATAHHHAQPQLHDSLDVSEWLTRSLRNSIDESTARLQSGLAVLASVGSTAPFVGLFGTVWGIYHALLSISAAGHATIDKVAGPIGEALIMTALGLAVAIPAVLGYNALVRGNKSVLNKLNRFAHDLHAYFVTGARVSSNGDPKVVPMKSRS
jgi:biopolymer transport protein ExbB